jgi:glycosyltransferase involved in cell wall biosynthesis
VTGALSRHLVEHGFPADKIMTIMNGVDAGRFVPEDPGVARKMIGIPEKALVIGIVGRFGPFKRHAMLLEAFQTLAAVYPSLHLLVVGGGGPEQKAISNKAKRHPYSDRIHLTGFQENPVPYYQAMDLLVVPSVNEGLSNAVLEAMACGIPVLANAACGNGDVIDEGKNGFVADLDSSEKLHLKLRQLLSEPARLTAMRETCRDKAVREFSIDQMVSGYASLYREIGRPNSRFQT